MNKDMKTYVKPVIELTEIRELSLLAASPLKTSTSPYQSGESVLSNRRRDQWSNGWDD